MIKSVARKKKITNELVIKKLKGKRGTKVKVTVLRHGSGKPKDYLIVRDVIPTLAFDAAYMTDKNTGYVRITKFSATTLRGI